MWLLFVKWSIAVSWHTWLKRKNCRFFSKMGLAQFGRRWTSWKLFPCIQESYPGKGILLASLFIVSRFSIIGHFIGEAFKLAKFLAKFCAAVIKTHLDFYSSSIDSSMRRCAMRIFLWGRCIWEMLIAGDIFPMYMYKFTKKKHVLCNPTSFLLVKKLEYPLHT